jgi:hypothetical protein
MGTDIKGIHVPSPRLIATGVYLQLQGVLSATTKTTLKALGAGLRNEGDVAIVLADRSRWVFSAASTAADTSENLVLTPAAGSGRWLRVDHDVHMKFAIAFGTADATVLHTVPTGFRLTLQRLWWEVTADFTGGSSSAIGVSSATAPHETKGDLLGGASGDVAATLVAAGVNIGGTIGASFGSNGVVVLAATNTIRFDRITSAFTAGTGFVHVLARQIT